MPKVNYVQPCGGSDITITYPSTSGTLALSGAGLTGFIPSQNTAAPNNTVNASRLLVDATTANADIVLQPKGSGAFLAQLPDNATTGGNKRGSYAVDLQTQRTAANQVAAGNNSVIGGGYANRIDGLGTASVIAGGNSNLLQNAGYSSILGGNANAVYAQNSSVVGGSGNYCNNQYSSVLGGFTNANQGYVATLISGGNNTINSGADYGLIGSGTNNNVNAAYSSIINGSSNNNSASYVSIVTGQFNTASTGSSTYGLIAGASCGVYHEGGIAFGVAAGTTTNHQKVWSSGLATGNSGDVQQAEHHLYTTTTNGSNVNLTIGGATLSNTTSVAVPLNGTFLFKAIVSCKRSPTSTADFGAWEVTGLAVNLAGTVTLFGTTVTIIHRTNGGYTVNAVADNTNKTVNIVVQGVAGHTIIWSAYVNTIRSVTA